MGNFIVMSCPYFGRVLLLKKANKVTEEFCCCTKMAEKHEAVILTIHSSIYYI